MKPIAHIHTDFTTKFGVPRQAGLVKELRAATARKPQEPPQKGGFLGLLKKFKGK